MRIASLPRRYLVEHTFLVRTQPPSWQGFREPTDWHRTMAKAGKSDGEGTLRRNARKRRGCADWGHSGEGDLTAGAPQPKQPSPPSTTFPSVIRRNLQDPQSEPEKPHGNSARRGSG